MIDSKSHKLTVNCEFHFTHMLKASGCLEVKEWELGDLKDTKSGQLLSFFHQPEEWGSFLLKMTPWPIFSRFLRFFMLRGTKNLTFSQRVQKSSKLSENDTCKYLRIFLNYGAKQPSQKKIRVYEGPKICIFSCKSKNGENG